MKDRFEKYINERLPEIDRQDLLSENLESGSKKF